MCQRRDGFTLVELVVVVMILGVLAAIAMPRLISTTDTARDNSLRQTLTVIRDAIDSYSAANSTLPGSDGNQATFKTDVAPYLRGAAFPPCPVGEAANDAIRMQGGNGSIAANIGGTAASHGWAYKYETGDFHVNSTEIAADSVTTYDQF